MLVCLLPCIVVFFGGANTNSPPFSPTVMHSGWNCSWRVNFAEWPLWHPVNSAAIPDRCCFSHACTVGQGRGTRKTIGNGSRRFMIIKALHSVDHTCIYQHPACSGSISSDRQAPCGRMIDGSHGCAAWRDLSPKLGHHPPTEEPVLQPLETLYGGHSPHQNEWTWKAECPLDKLLWCVNEQCCSVQMGQAL